MDMKRKQLKSIDEIIGRTVKGAAIAGCVSAISFTDGSFIVMEAERDDYNDGMAIEVDRYPAEASHRLVQAGIFTNEEVLEQQKADLYEQSQRERRAYERLKKKFEAEEE